MLKIFDDIVSHFADENLKFRSDVSTRQNYQRRLLSFLNAKRAKNIDTRLFIPEKYLATLNKKVAISNLSQ